MSCSLLFLFKNIGGDDNMVNILKPYMSTLDLFTNHPAVNIMEASLGVKGKNSTESSA